MKKRTMNELRQTKDTHYVNPTFKTEVKNPFEHEDVDKAVDQIVETLQPEIFDAIFEAVNTEMGNNFLFQSENYLTEAGEELFEDEWFEFYHEQHGKIMHKLLQNLK